MWYMVFRLLREILVYLIIFFYADDNLVFGRDTMEGLNFKIKNKKIISAYEQASG